MASLTPSPTPGTLVEAPRRVSRRRIRVLIALSSAMECQLLLGAAHHARQQFEVAGCAVSRSEVLAFLSRSSVDVALISRDLQDGSMTGLELLHELHSSYPHLPPVVLFDALDDDLIVRAFRAGAAGVFCRSEKKLEVLWRCIRAVYEGQIWANSGQLRLLLKTLQTIEQVPKLRGPALKLLGGREQQVARLVAQGLQNKQIATELRITAHTVSNYLFRIYNKLGVSGRVELVLYVNRQPELFQACPISHATTQTSPLSPVKKGATSATGVMR